MTKPNLESERLLYKPLSLNHLSMEYVSWMNDLDVIRYLESGGDYTLEMLENYLKNVEQQEIFSWGIHLKNNGKHIGNIKIDPISIKHKRAEYGIMMGDKNEWGKGYAKEATSTILNYCFEELKLRKITLGVVLDNIAAYTLYQNIGFKTEGVLKSHSLHEGKYCDVVRMAIFKDDVKYD